MKQIIKFVIGLLAIFILAFSGIGIISASVNASHAEQFATDVADTIEASNFSSSVINECKQMATAAGYELTVTDTHTDENGHIDMAEVVLKYDYVIAIFNIRYERYAKAYAR